jgi:hypothetical protein
MRDLRTRVLTAAVAALLALGAGVAVGCGAAGIGLGSLGLAIGAFAVYLALAAGAGPACYASHPDEDIPGHPEVCLTYMGEDGEGTDDAGVCLTPTDVRDDADVGPCLEPPLEASEDADVGPCLEPPMDASDDVGSDGLPICPPELCDICLNSPIDWCILECPPPDAGGSATAEPRSAAQQRLASAGVLSPEQLARLRRLQGRSA